MDMKVWHATSTPKALHFSSNAILLLKEARRAYHFIQIHMIDEWDKSNSNKEEPKTSPPIPTP